MEPLAELDAAMATAWPPAVSTAIEGWLFRFTSGVTQRANSVLACGTPQNLAGTVDEAERFYLSRNLQPRFLVSEASSPAALPEFLVGRGYSPSNATWLLLANVVDVLALLSETDEGSTSVAAELTNEWFDAYWEVESERKGAMAASILRNVLLRPEAPTKFVVAKKAQRVQSVGQIVVDRGLACAQCLATLGWARRQGSANAVLRRLAIEAEIADATKIFAAVEETNEASLGLFDRAGFERSHQYRYYTGPH